jgi:TolA-binding protein
LQDRLRQAVSNELDAVREKNELTNYYTELLLDTTTKLEETSIIMDASFSTTAGSASSDEDRELVKCLVDSMCAMCENNLLKDQLGQLQQQYQQLQEDNTAINSELLDEYQHHESDIESVQTKLESDFSVKLEENRTITRDTALSAIRTNEIRRGQQFLELSKQVQDYHSRVEQLTQLRHQEMELYTMREQELRAEFDRAVRSIAKASRLGEANSSDQAHALEELQSEVALLNITLFNLKADQISPSQECLTTERIEEQSKQVVVSPASLPDTGTENTTTTYKTNEICHYLCTLLSLRTLAVCGIATCSRLPQQRDLVVLVFNFFLQRCNPVLVLADALLESPVIALQLLIIRIELG